MSIISITTGDWKILYRTLHEPANDAHGLRFMFLVSGFIGFLVTMMCLMVIKLCGPVALNITTILKEDWITFLGLFIYQNIDFTKNLFVWLVFSVAGATFYSQNKYKD